MAATTTKETQVVPTPCADLGVAARQMIAGPAPCIAYINACQGYISTARMIREDGYEGDISHMAYFLPAPFAEQSEEKFLSLPKGIAGSGIELRPDRALRRLPGNYRKKLTYCLVFRPKVRRIPSYAPISRHPLSGPGGRSVS